MSNDRVTRRSITIVALSAGLLGLPVTSPAFAEQPPAPDPVTTTPAPPPAPVPPPPPAPPPQPPPSPPAPAPGGPAQPAPAPGAIDTAPEPFADHLDLPSQRTPEQVKRDYLIRQRRARAEKEAQERKERSERAAAREDRAEADADDDEADDEDDEEGADETASGADGTPLAAGTLPAEIPNFFIGSFRIPPFLLSIYQAAGIQYGVPWEVLAAINEIETDYGRNLNVSSAGAMGWMQFMPSSWAAYGVDANGDGEKDPYNPVDAIFAAARYLKAAGAGEDLRKAIFAYNHAVWYVDSVLQRARLIAGMPSELVSSLTGLTQGRTPVAGTLRYAQREAGSPARTSLRIDAPAGTPVVAVQDGEIVRIGRSERLGRYVILRDAYGNTYTYANLAKVATDVLVAKERAPKPGSGPPPQPLAGPAIDPVPSGPASAGTNDEPPPQNGAGADPQADADDPDRESAPPATVKERLFAHPGRTRSLPSGGRQQILDATFALPASARLRSYFAGEVGLERDELELKRLLAGRRVIAGTILGRVGTNGAPGEPHMRFSIRPPGEDAPRIDPQPFLEGWRLLESTAIYRPRGPRALTGGSIGQIMLMSKDTLARRVLADPAIEVYACGRRDIQAGLVDRRVLATLEFLAANGLRPTVSSLRCGHRSTTASGRVSQHASGNGVDIVKINGKPVLGNQGAGSIADATVRRLLTLQGAMAPAQIISLMSYTGQPTALAQHDHADHIHIGFRPQGGAGGRGIHARGLRPSQWLRLVDRLGRIENPSVSPTTPRRP
ncbi:MAG: lytic murein transglycosylase [Solirubrobacteraceae bacterium]|nr:lytic murein transglycosylase [Solirubrobacteraceae bacterium]